MSHVPTHTVLRRLAATSLVLLTGTSLVACGGDDDANQPARVPNASTAAGTTPATPTTPTTPTGPKIGAAETNEGARAVRKASKKKISMRKRKAEIKKAIAALESGGYAGAKVSTSSKELTTVIVDGTSLIFFSSDREAAEAGAQYVDIIKARPGYSRVARTDNRVYIVSAKAALLAESDAEKLKKIREIVDAAL